MPRFAVLAVVVVASMAFSLVGCGAPDGSRADQASIDRMIDTVKATRDGERIDLGDILDGPWDRAVLMEPYLDGAAMKDRLGFEGYAPDAVSQQDEAAQFVVFVVDRSVTADTVLFDTEFQFDGSITEFDRTDSTFVVRHLPSGIVLTPP